MENRIRKTLPNVSVQFVAPDVYRLTVFLSNSEAWESITEKRESILFALRQNLTEYHESQTAINSWYDGQRVKVELSVLFFGYEKEKGR